MRVKRSRIVLAIVVAFGCGQDGGSNDDTATSVSTGSSSSGSTGTVTASGGPSTSAEGSTTGDDPKFDVMDSAGDAGDSGPIDVCKVQEDDAIGPCETEAPPASFEPDVQWTWTGVAPEDSSMVTPLVANLSDDNDDGEIDLCDIPDVVIVTRGANAEAHLHVLDGATGVEHFAIPEDVSVRVTPAIGDIDDDGIPEIVTATGGGIMMAFEHDGSLKWQSTSTWASHFHGAVALGDVDNDGDVEIVAGDTVWDHLGTLLATQPETPGPQGYGNAVTAADIDGDDDLEIVMGRSVYHHDGTPLWQNQQLEPGYPQVANLDGDPQPEILLMNTNGISVIEHDGTVKYQDQRPTGDIGNLQTWMRPATVHDFDGDDVSEFAVSSANHYTVYEPDATIVWSSIVADLSGSATGTAFDFLGDASAEAMYADESTLYVFDDMGAPLLTAPRSSGTFIEYPTVTDVDNDGSAEILVVSNNSPTVQAIRDTLDRWVPARRIWNQHTYHVTNVREDGTIPQIEKHHWELLNTFRTQAQVEGGICKPEG